MSRIVNIDPTGADILLPAIGVTVHNGDAVEVPDEVAERLIQTPQWRLVTTDRTKAIKAKSEES